MASHPMRRAARIGNPYAQLMLGNCYANGTGVAKDPQQAVRWWRKAGDNNYPQAQYLMGKRRAPLIGSPDPPSKATRTPST